MFARALWRQEGGKRSGKKRTGPVLEGWAASFIIYLANTGPVPLASSLRP
jgi:hypothetical protein